VILCLREEYCLIYFISKEVNSNVYPWIIAEVYNFFTSTNFGLETHCTEEELITLRFVSAVLLEQMYVCYYQDICFGRLQF